MDSKNFNAAEKYFEKKRIKMHKEIDSISMMYKEAVDKLAAKEMENSDLRIENEKLNKTIENTAMLKDLSKEQIDKLSKASGNMYVLCHAVKAVSSKGYF